MGQQQELCIHPKIGILGASPVIIIESILQLVHIHSYVFYMDLGNPGTVTTKG